ncbi:MAG TPA: FkbM family methyltransferase [Roseococcus sp.]|jgi:FkbM family methyltransferase|nr:FkbM family methyltransferase [Roseococcus sp.]
MEEIDFFRALHRPGTILDIGAHDGLLTAPLAELPGAHVIAFEPLPSAMARLRERLGTHPRVTLRTEALGAAHGEATLTLPVVAGEAAEQWASLAKTYAGHAGVTTERHPVTVLPLDALELTDVTAIKLDAEGYEEEVLRGGRETLRRCRPVLSVEIEERHRPGSTVAVPALLAEWGYTAWFWHAGRLHPFAAFDAATMQVASPDPSVFAASDPYIFTFFFLPGGEGLRPLARAGFGTTEPGTAG